MTEICQRPRCDRHRELDVLPLDALRDRIVAEVESRMDLDALARMR
jgi:hypothetical protein